MTFLTRSERRLTPRGDIIRTAGNGNAPGSGDVCRTAESVHSLEIFVGKDGYESLEHYEVQSED